MMKKTFLMVFFMAAFLAVSTFAFAAPFKYAYLFGQSINESNHIFVGMGIETIGTGTPVPTVDVGDGNGPQSLNYDYSYTEGSDNIEAWWLNGPGLAPWNPGQQVNPTTLLNNTVTFTSGSDVITARISDETAGDPYNGFFIMPASYDFGVVGGTFENPVITWKNDWSTSAPVGLSRYEVRVYEEGGSLVMREKLYDNLDQVEQFFDFDTVAFAFNQTQNYTVRIETRKSVDLLDQTGSSADWVGIVNRDVYDNPYSAVPLPGALVLLGSGILGLIGLRRRLK